MQQTPNSPLGYDRPLSPTAVSRDVYRRSVPGISDLVRGTTNNEVPFETFTNNSSGGTNIFQQQDGWSFTEQQQQQQPQQQQYQQSPFDTSMYYPPTSQQLPQQSYLQQRQQHQTQPYSIATSVFDEPIHQPFLNARGGVSSVPVSTDRRLGDLDATINTASFSQTSDAQGTNRNAVTGGGVGGAIAISSTPELRLQNVTPAMSTATESVQNNNDRLQFSVDNIEKQVIRTQRSLSRMNEQQQTYRMQTIAKQDEILEDAEKNHNRQTKWLFVIAAGVAILLVMSLIVAVYTVLKTRSSSAERTAVKRIIPTQPEGNRSNASETTNAANPATVSQKSIDVASATNVAPSDFPARKQQQSTKPMETDISEGIDSDAYASQLREQRLSTIPTMAK